jgi:hypothetical protein
MIIFFLGTLVAAWPARESELVLVTKPVPVMVGEV